MEIAKAAAAAIGVVTVGSVCSAMAAGLYLPEGAAFRLGNGALDVGCSDLQIAGKFSANDGYVSTRHLRVAGSGALSFSGKVSVAISGDWDVAGLFEPAQSTVALVDGCGVGIAAASGASRLYNLTVQSSESKTLIFSAARSWEVAGSLNILGSPGYPVTIASDDGSALRFFVQGNQQVIHAIVDDLLLQGPLNPAFYSGLPRWLLHHSAIRQGSD